jgi:hypothetical protein
MLRLFILIIALFFAPVFSLAQERSIDPAGEFNQFSIRYSALHGNFNTLLKRYVDSGEMYAKRRAEFTLLISVMGNLHTSNCQMIALQGHLLLRMMVTDKPLAEQARSFMSTQYQSVKETKEANIFYIENLLHVSRDQEFTKLLLEARDLDRAVAEYLGRIDTNR